ncbi:head GIN domain-containing protein [Massilia sp. CMS3.1]|uniref:head GIN domain-containing protein n=1 Tax=Massilia sp. CMS3.1 TaxID=3373083 RepID=UPI003EE6F118
MRAFAPSFALVLALSLAAGAAQAADQVRAAAPFTSIKVQGPISVTVDAGTAQQSVLARGSDKFINGLTSEVVNGELRLHMRDKNLDTNAGEQRIIVKMAQLRAFSAEGAGEIKLNNIRGERLDVSYRGAGSMAINGKVNAFKMTAEGVGEVDTKALIANDVDIRFRGIGDIKVYARDKLDVTVQGMGKLSYYGKPKTMNKSIAGLGSVNAGD